jgi:SAM-dependent methyltransferase
MKDPEFSRERSTPSTPETERRTLDIGCGWRKTPGAVGMDVLAESAADVVADLNERWPFPDGSFDRVVANHVLEHVPDVIHVVDEAWRVLTPGGVFVVRGPHFSSPHLVWSDPTHRRGLSAAMFLHFQPGTIHPYGHGRFERRSAFLSIPGAHPYPHDRIWRTALRGAFRALERAANRSPLAQARAERIWSRWVPFDEVTVELVRAER